MSPNRFDGQVVKLVNGGQGLIHHQKGTVLVNDVLPGEIVQFTIREHGRGIFWADLADVRSPHPQRISPPCPLAGVCGGCAWQHIPLPLQRELKQTIFCDSFSHQQKQNPPLNRLHPSPGTAYRVRARMKPDEQGRLGFVRRRSHDIVPINNCLLFCQQINDFLEHWNADPPRLRQLRQLDLLFSPGSEVLGIHLSHRPQESEIKDLQSRFPKLLLGYPGDEVVQIIEIPDIPHPFHASPAAFFQVNRHLWSTMLNTVSRHLPETFWALDLYSVVGFLIPPLLRGLRPPMAAESHPLSVRLARLSFPHLQILRCDSNHLDIPKGLDLIVCDPPRSGLSPTTRTLICESSVKTLLYISCNQSTLLRDTNDLLQRGWHLDSMEAFDLFPHTPHLEIFSRLSR